MPPGIEAATELPSVGDRVVDANGFRATVRYVGPVSTAKDPEAMWIGEQPMIFTGVFYPCVLCAIPTARCARRSRIVNTL